MIIKITDVNNTDLFSIIILLTVMFNLYNCKIKISTIPVVLVRFRFLRHFLFSDTQKPGIVLINVMLLNLSRSIASKPDLRNLAVVGLHMKIEEVQIAIGNHPGDFTSAVFDILTDWLKGQEDEIAAATTGINNPHA